MRFFAAVWPGARRVGCWLWDHRAVALPMAIGLAALLLRLYGLGDKPFWLDEVTSLRRATASVPALVSDSLNNTHYPTYFLLLWLVAKFGTSQWLLRLPSAVFGALGAALTCVLGGRVGNLRAGEIAIRGSIRPRSPLLYTGFLPHSDRLMRAGWPLATARRRGAAVWRAGGPASGLDCVHCGYGGGAQCPQRRHPVAGRRQPRRARDRFGRGSGATGLLAELGAGPARHPCRLGAVVDCAMAVATWRGPRRRRLGPRRNVANDLVHSGAGLFAADLQLHHLRSDAGRGPGAGRRRADRGVARRMALAARHHDAVGPWRRHLDPAARTVCVVGGGAGIGAALFRLGGCTLFRVCRDRLGAIDDPPVHRAGGGARRARPGQPCALLPIRDKAALGPGGGKIDQNCAAGRRGLA